MTTPNRPSRSIAFFVTPHGFGHAARAAAVMAALQDQYPGVRLEIFTRVPRWFFATSLTKPFRYHDCLTDIGLVQASSLQEDLGATVERLEQFLPFRKELVAQLADQLRRLRCELVVCDIAPLGIEVAQAAGLPSLLIENFTWDWIYEGYRKEEPRLQKYTTYLKGIFRAASYHVQTEPISHPAAGAWSTGLVSRAPRASVAATRRELGIGRRASVVLITMGGIPGQYAFLDCLRDFPGVQFIIPGASRTPRRRDNLILLPHRSRFYHPDLLTASNAVVGKVGYSTVAEAYHAGVPFGYIPRARFRESPALTAFIRARMPGLKIEDEQFLDGRWLDTLPALLELSPTHRQEPNGAGETAAFILQAPDTPSGYCPPASGG